MSLTVKPSLQGRFSLVYSGDPALQPRPEDLPEGAQSADVAERDEAQKKWDHDLTVARERGEWGPLVKPGDRPTTFLLELPRGAERRKLLDLFNVSWAAGHHVTAMCVMFRGACREVTNLPGVDIRLVREDGIDLVDSETVARLDAIDPAIVNELGSVAYRRMTEAPGK